MVPHIRERGITGLPGTVSRMGGAALHIRRLGPEDSLEEVTDLLHRAYAELARQGLRYVASHQGPDVTRRRIADGECYLGEVGGRVVATVTLQPPGAGRGPGLYRRPDVAKVQQFGVDPDHQRHGIGTQLMEHVEARARELGAARIALDTSEHAEHLIRWYESRGYRQVGRYDWRPHTNYLSVLLSREL